jgi:hypothetical protein
VSLDDWLKEAEEKGGINLLDYAFARRAIPQAIKIIKRMRTTLEMIYSANRIETQHDEAKWAKETLDEIEKELSGNDENM